jgi:hypothetical protein
MTWFSQELVQAVMQMMKMSVLQCLRVDQVNIYSIFHMSSDTLTAEAFNPLKTHSDRLYPHITRRQEYNTNAYIAEFSSVLSQVSSTALTIRPQPFYFCYS